MFSIEILPVRTVDDTDPQASIGRVRINDFSEKFQVDLSFWGADDYRRSWRNAFAAIDSASDGIACFLTSVTDPAKSNFVTCWPLYREGDVVYIQNTVLFLENLRDIFDLEYPWRSLDPRATTDEDGNKISEWAADLNDMRAFFERGADPR
ncbi:hypothetical protein L3Q67_26105 [Saccharothrix sp. AJ9571]|nr:hypothetical protein L3Q67_26105 [Saccharothrix sp. AJ9571]